MHSALRSPIVPPVPHADGAPWSLPEAAEFIGISLSSAERAVRSGAIKSFKVGGRRLIADAEVRRVTAGG